MVRELADAADTTTSEIWDMFDSNQLQLIHEWDANERP
jgi:hypothetical protein